MSAKRLLMVFLISLLVFLLISAPARLVAAFLPDASATANPSVAWAPLTGSVWSGKTQWLQVDQIRVQPLQWRIAPIGAIFGTPLKIQASEPVVLAAHVGGNGEQLTVRGLEVTGTLNDLVSAAVGMTLGLDARLELTVGELNTSPTGCGTLESGIFSAKDWSSESWQLESIGQIDALLACEAGQYLITIVEPNAIGLSGQIQASSDGRYRVNLKAKPPKGDVYDLLDSFFGPARRGEFVINHSG